jgi:uncharacterized protein (TIGR00251 family)
MLKKYINELVDKKEVYLRVKVRPNAGETALKEILADNTIKIDIAAPPKKGKANQELISYLADQFRIHKENVKIISGSREKIKLIKIEI